MVKYMKAFSLLESQVGMVKNSTLEDVYTKANFYKA